MRYGRLQVVLAMALGSAWAGCGSEEVFEPQLASSERLVERSAVATIAGDDQLITHVTVVGDLDGDGIDDAIVQTEYAIRGTYTVGAGVHVLYGGKPASGKFDVASLPALTGAGAESGTVAAVGDIDGDGLADFLVGIGSVPGCGNPQVTKVGDPPEHSGAYLVYGSHTRVTGTTALASVGALLQDATPCTLASGVANLGDLDGDGKTDFAISRQVFDGPAMAYVFYGRSARLSGTLDLAATADATITTQDPGLAPLIAVGDIDGDGHHDFIVSASPAATGANTVGHGILRQDLQLVRGSATRWSGTVALADIASSQFPDDESCSDLPAKIGAGLGDLDGDGLDDFALVGCRVASTAPTTFQMVQRVFYGRAGGFPAHITAGSEDAAISIAADFSGGSQVAAADLDGDGMRDLVVTETLAHAGNGAVHVIHGTGKRLTGTVSPTDRAISYVGMPQQETHCDFMPPGCVAVEELGDEVSIGDLTGDHKPDLLINAPTDQVVAPYLGEHGTEASHAYVVPLSAPKP